MTATRVSNTAIRSVCIKTAAKLTIQILPPPDSTITLVLVIVVKKYKRGHGSPLGPYWGLKYRRGMEIPPVGHRCMIHLCPTGRISTSHVYIMLSSCS